MPLRPWLALLAVLMGLAGCATTAQIAPYVGTYRAVSAGEVLHLRIGPDGSADFFVPADGRQFSGKAAFGRGGDQANLVGLLGASEVFSVGRTGASRSLSIGQKLYALEPLPAAQFGVRAPAAQQQPAAGGGVGSGPLAGMRLSTAKSSNGYFTERSYDFCADGTVYTRFAEMQSSQLGSGAGERLDNGRWRQSGSSLQLNLARGGAQSLTLQQVEANVVRLDGVSYAVARSARCR
jgi:hypothetical protein